MKNGAETKAYHYSPRGVLTSMVHAREDSETNPKFGLLSVPPLSKCHHQWVIGEEYLHISTEHAK